MRRRGPARDGGAGEPAAARRSVDTMKSEPSPPATLGSTAAAGVRIITWCKACGHQTEPGAAEMAERYGAEVPVLDWKDRLRCSRCGGRDIDMVLTGQRR
jgi:hypothetical protein